MKRGKRKTAIIFASERNETKQKRKNAIIFASKRNGSKIFLLRCEKSVIFACFRIWSKTKMKLSENKAKNVYFVSLWSETKRSEAKRSETKKIRKQNKAKIRSINFALDGSEKKRKKKLFFHVSVRNACETDLVSLRFALKRQIFFCETGAPYEKVV
jgi:succinate dehydrogenase flavin-adding protein (antitoxin of CptAB toxin-antitoxin module)